MKATKVKSMTFKKVQKGAKISNDLRPEVKTGSAINKFTMNASASRLMNVQNGDYIAMIEGENGVYALAKTTKEEGVKLASTGHKPGVGKPLSFNYAGVWSCLVQNTPGAVPYGEDQMVKLGLMKEVFTQKNKEGKDCYTNLAVHRVALEVQRLEEEDGSPITIDVEGVTYDEVFVLVNPEIKVNSFKEGTPIDEDADEDFAEEL